MLNELVGIDLDSGVDVRRLKAVMAPADHEARGVLPVVVGSRPDRVLQALDEFVVVQVGPGPPIGPPRNVAAVVGLHGFSNRSGAADASFSMQMVDDWGIDEVVASALDLASRQG